MLFMITIINYIITVLRMILKYSEQMLQWNE